MPPAGRHARPRAAAACAALVGLLLGCSPSGSAGPEPTAPPGAAASADAEEVAASLSAARGRWRASDLDDNRARVTAGGTADVVVVDGEAVQVVPVLDPGEGWDGQTPFPATVEELFTTLADGLDGADEVDFDVALGHPVRAVLDGGTELRVDDLVPLPTWRPVPGEDRVLPATAQERPQLAGRLAAAEARRAARAPTAWTGGVSCSGTPTTPTTPLFDLLEDEAARADARTVVTHPGLGYPVRVEVDRLSSADDDELVHLVTALVPRG